MRSWLKTMVALVALLMAGVAQAGAPASDFTLRNIDGNEVSLSDFKGQVVVLSFWATWCGPCKEEMPHLEALYKEHKDQGLVVLSISSDDARTASQVKPFIKRSRYSFPVVLDKQSTVTGTYNPTKTLPFTVIIDRDFQQAYTHSGYNPGDEKELAKKVVELLAQPAP